MIKKMVVSIIVFGLSIFSLGCSLDEGTEGLYKKENVLQIEMDLPEEIDRGEAVEINVLMSQADGEVPELENLEFLIWKNGESEHADRFQPKDQGNGRYTVNTIVKEEGLHFVKVEANTVDSKVMPTKQFVVGSLTEEDKNSFPQHNDHEHHEGHH